MSRTCAYWRSLLDTELSVIDTDQRDALNEHLSGCPDCRIDEESRAALRSILNSTVTEMVQINPDEFQSKVFEQLMEPPKSPDITLCLLQVCAGALAAIAATLLILVPGLHPVKSQQLRWQKGNFQQNVTAFTPLDKLLHAPNPRAAMLWLSPPPTKVDIQKSVDRG